MWLEEEVDAAGGTLGGVVDRAGPGLSKIGALLDAPNPPTAPGLFELLLAPPTPPLLLLLLFAKRLVGEERRRLEERYGLVECRAEAVVLVVLLERSSIGACPGSPPPLLSEIRRARGNMDMVVLLTEPEMICHEPRMSWLTSWLTLLEGVRLAGDDPPSLESMPRGYDAAAAIADENIMAALTVDTWGCCVVVV